MIRSIKKQKIIFWLPTLIFILILGYALYITRNEAEIKYQIILAVIAGYATIYFGLGKYFMEGDKMFRELFTEFNERFNSMNEDLNKIVNNVELHKGQSAKTENDIIQDYLNLCSEEYLWYKRGRIDEEVWIAWKKGIEYYLTCEKIHVYFREQKKYNRSYYGLFGQLEFPTLQPPAN